MGQISRDYAGLCVNVNGTDFCDSWFDWSSYFDPLTKKDGGWYIQFNGDNVAANFVGGTPTCK